MITRNELNKYLESYLQVAKIADYCPNGLQVEGKDEILKVAFAVTVSLEVIEQAALCGADALLVHHGIFWNGDSYPLVGTKKIKIQRLLENGISLFAYHLPLDIHSEVGNNWKAARDLGWANLMPFGSFQGNLIGVKGVFPKEPIESFVNRLETYYGHKATFALGGKKEIASAALISGGAYKSLKEAADSGVDCFITGNFDEPAWHVAKEEGIHFLALGHSATERVGVQALAAHLQEHFGLDCPFLDVYNPF